MVPRVPQPPSIPKISLGRAVSQPSLMQNLVLETPYTFKKSYGITPEPQTAQDTPWLHGSSLPEVRMCIHTAAVVVQRTRYKRTRIYPRVDPEQRHRTSHGSRRSPP